jgi:predicted peptidase
MTSRYRTKFGIMLAALCLQVGVIFAPPAFAQQPKQPGPAAAPKPGGMMQMQVDARVQNRTYLFKETNEDMEYALFVSSKATKDKKNPLIVTLHGLGAGPTIMLTKEVLELAEADGYIVVSPMGYNVRGWYGIPTGPGPGMGKVPPAAKKEAATTDPAPKPKASMFSNPDDPPNLRELSEKDVMNVLDIVRKEFTIDENRIYLMGHSMGGGGTLHLGIKYPSIWAALAPIAPAAFSLNPDSLEKIRHMPVIVIQGAADTLVTPEGTRRWVDKMKELNMTHEYKEMEGIDHGAVITAGLPAIYEFFGRHSKKPAR